MTSVEAPKQELLAFWRAYEAVREEVQQEVEAAARAMPAFAIVFQMMSDAEREKINAQSHEMQRRAIELGEWDALAASLREQGIGYARMGIPFGKWFDVINTYRRALSIRMNEFYADDADAQQAAAAGVNAYIDFSMAAIGDAYVLAKEDIIKEQQEAIRELSTPVLQVRPRLLVVPLVGMVDTHRARQLTEAVLAAIPARRAKVVILDITGVPIVDSKVANHLVQTVEAARLMGAKVVVTGISVGIARTLVTIGAELPGVQTLQDLQDGIVEAERLLNGLKQDDTPPPPGED